jgi:hypothetical protein
MSVQFTSRWRRSALTGASLIAALLWGVVELVALQKATWRR